MKARPMITPPRLSPRPPTRPGLFRRTPPAAFPAILGLLGLGVAWRRGVDAFGIPEAVVEIYLGGASLIFGFAAAAYGVKVMFRPGVLPEDFRVLPGRAGLAALTMSVMLMASVLAPYAPAVARAVLLAGLLLHAGVATAVLAALIAGPPEKRMVTPVLHLSFVGFIVGAVAAVPLGMPVLAVVLQWMSLAAALVVWALTLGPLLTGATPPPLRPLHAIHLAPAALIGTTGFLTTNYALGNACALLAMALFAVLIARARWMTAAGFSGFWGAFTFPLTAFAGMLFLAAGAWGSETLRSVAGLALILATLAVPPIGFQVLRLWARGTLAQKTNAAIA